MLNEEKQQIALSSFLLSSIDAVWYPGLDLVDRYLNDRPKKCLEWQTPREAMNAWLSDLAP